MFYYNSILNIPERLLVNKRITKAFFSKNFELKASEKKVLNQVITNMEWLASIKPSTANVPAIKNNTWVYEEIQVMTCSTHHLENNLQSCIELFQKYIPYQILLIVEDQNEFALNICDKRVNQNDKTKRTIDSYLTTKRISKLYKNTVTSAFFSALDYNQIDKSNLETLYKSYNRAIVQYQTANLTGSYTIRTQQRTDEDMQMLLKIEEIEKEINRLSSQLKKATQLNDKVSLNVKIQNKRKEIKQIKNKLTQNEH